MGTTTFADIVTAAIGVLTDLGIMPLVVAGGVIGVFGVLLRRVRSGVR